MCLLIMLTGVHPDAPLIIGANRDELLERPAVPMTVLREASPRILGGRDELAGGTWLAVNDAGVVAGLTNRPLAGQRDPTKRSRGELPLALAGYTSAAAAVAAFGSEFNPKDFNPSWLLVGDRESAFAIDMTGDAALVTPLPPGVHILENRPADSFSPKVEHVRQLVGNVDGLSADELTQRLETVLRDHEVPAAYADGSVPVSDNAEIPPQVKAACVHAERYGTRWSSVISVPADHHARPTVRYADGPPCQVPYADAGWLWCTTPNDVTAATGSGTR